MVKGKTFIFSGLLAALALGWCASARGEGSGDRSVRGVFSILTYNVAGLPEPLSGSRPAKYTRRISERINAFDLVVTQEDFWYHRDLVSAAEFPLMAPGNRAGTLGDGLSRFSRFPMTEVRHEAWQTCFGWLGHASDCLTKKGFAWADHELAPGVWLAVYDLHLDAGGAPGDQEARARQMEQLMAALRRSSAGRAVIVAGDWNLSGHWPLDLEVLERILKEEGLTDVCRALGCPEERVDRILFRSGGGLELIPRRYTVEVERFQNEDGEQLSDHEAVSAVFEWRYGGREDAGEGLGDARE